MARLALRRWRLPGTEMDFVQVQDGPRAGEYLVSAETVDRLPEFYAKIANLPYKPGAAKQLNEVFRTLSTGSTNTLYEAFRSSPAGLLAIVPLRWMVNLPAWTQISLAGVTVWQWLGLSTGLLLGVPFILVSHHEHQTEDEQQVVGSEQNVLDTLYEVGAGDIRDPLRCSDLDPRLRWMHKRDRVSVVERLDPDQNVGDGSLQAHELDPLAGKAGLAGVDQATFEQLTGEFFDRWRDEVARIVWELQHYWQPHPSVDRGTPQHFIAAWSCLVDLKGTPGATRGLARPWRWPVLQVACREAIERTPKLLWRLSAMPQQRERRRRPALPGL